MTKIFITYRRDDSAYIAGIINEELEKHFGPNSVFLDIDSIPLGLDFRKHIADSVGKCDVLLVVIGDSWINAVNEYGSRRLEDPADFVRVEIESALKRDIPVIPVLVGNALMPSEAELPPSLQALDFRNAAEVRAGLDKQEHLARLIEGINLLSKSNQTALEPQQRSNHELTGGTSAMKVTTPSTGAQLKNGMQRTHWKRWVFSFIILIIFAIAGLFVGQMIEDTLYDESAGWFGVVLTWLSGVFLIYKVWQRYSRT